MSKINDLADVYGYENDMEMLELMAFESVVPGICTNEDCSYTTDVEPDATDGWCEECNTGTVKSCMVLMGVI